MSDPSAPSEITTVCPSLVISTHEPTREPAPDAIVPTQSPIFVTVLNELKSFTGSKVKMIGVPVLTANIDPKLTAGVEEAI